MSAVGESKDITRKWRRRAWLGGVAAACVSGAGAYLYGQSPRFWHQYFQELGRSIEPPPAHPRPEDWANSGLYAAWLGHSTVLLKIDGFTILTDPVFSNLVGINFGPITLGIKRLVAPALRVARVPRVNMVLLSHAHMDHMDIPSLRSLESPDVSVVAAARTSDLLRARNYRRVTELRWGERARIGPVEIRAFEVNHWGARMRTDDYRGYNGYVIQTGRHRVLFGGDTAITDTFRSVRTSRPFELAIMPIGTYNPWKRYHCTPEQAWRMGNDAGAEFFLPVHHQTFQLSREPLLEPIERFYQAAGREPRRIAIQQIGQEFRLT